MSKIIIIPIFTFSFLIACNKNEKNLLTNKKNVAFETSKDDVIRIKKLKSFISVLLMTEADSIEFNEKDKIFVNESKTYKIGYDEINSIYESANEYKAKYESNK